MYSSELRENIIALRIEWQNSPLTIGEFAKRHNMVTGEITRLLRLAEGFQNQDAMVEEVLNDILNKD